MTTRTSIIIPVKNASKYIKHTIDSIGTQAHKDLIDLEFLYAESGDNTLELIKIAAIENNLNFNIHFEEKLYLTSLNKLVLQIKNPCFTFFCCSDEYINDDFLSNACDILFRNEEISFVHSDVLACNSRGSSRIRPGMNHRSIFKGAGAGRFYANISLLNEIMADLATVFRTSTVLQLLQAYTRNGSNKSNTFGEITIALFASGCIGHYIDRFSVIGHDHEDSLTNNIVNRPNLSWGILCSKLVKKLSFWIESEGFKWRDSNLVPFTYKKQNELRTEYYSQRDLILRIARRNHGWEGSL